MQPTVSPWAWVSSWDRRARTRVAGEYARERERVAPRRDRDKYAFYGLRKDSRHFIRLDPLAKGLLLSRQWGTGAPVTWRVDRFHDAPWAVPDVKSIQSFRPYEPVSIVLPGAEPAPAGGPGAGGAGSSGGRSAPMAHAWSHGARGWAAGAVLLALLVLLVRAAENCLHKKLFRAIYMHTNAGAAEMQQDQIMPGHYRLQGVRRQESDEWSTPNVMATSLQLQHRDFDAGSISRLDDIEGLSSPQRHASDMPPPYSACAAPPARPLDKLTSEEPPPPYSACYVAYTNPKDSEPQVHIRRHNTRDERVDSTTTDNVQNDLIENRLRAVSAVNTPTGDSEHGPGMRTEFVFDNGRILERLSLDLSSNSEEAGVASNDNVVQSARVTERSDRVVYIDETPSENTTPNRALLV